MGGGAVLTVGAGGVPNWSANPRTGAASATASAARVKSEVAVMIRKIPPRLSGE
jgi:hypothetical protein